MRTECNPTLFEFARVQGRAAVAPTDGGQITSDAGVLLFGAMDHAVGLIGYFAPCFSDARDPDLIEHGVETLVMPRVFGSALGSEDLDDHDQLRRNPVMAVLAGKLVAQRRSACAPFAGKSTLNHPKPSRAGPTRIAAFCHPIPGSP